MDEGQHALVSWVARVTARLAHKFADRQAILFRFGVDEEGWEAREVACLDLLATARRAGDPRPACAFAFAFEAARDELYGRVAALPPAALEPDATGLGDAEANTVAAPAPPPVVAAGPVDVTLKSPSTVGDAKNSAGTRP